MKRQQRRAEWLLASVSLARPTRRRPVPHFQRITPDRLPCITSPTLPGDAERVRRLYEVLRGGSAGPPEVWVRVKG